MSGAVVERLQEQFGDRILETSAFRGDEQVVVAPKDWLEVAQFLKRDPDLRMDHFVDITAVDYPEREPDLPRFDVLLLARSLQKKHRIRVKTRVGEDDELDSVVSIWAGADWAEREVFDMFGIRFAGHPDLRRILMYDEFSGYPLRKDYPIDRAQPLVPYRDVPGIHKLPPFGIEEGQPWGRIDWQQRLEGADRQVSPAIAVQVGQRRQLSDSDAYNDADQRAPEPARGAQGADERAPEDEA
ncbi:MAG: NADH-quinone oxidoreductase subunit C [Myxococcota bacterium]